MESDAEDIIAMALRRPDNSHGSAAFPLHDILHELSQQHSQELLDLQSQVFDLRRRLGLPPPITPPGPFSARLRWGPWSTKSRVLNTLVPRSGGDSIEVRNFTGMSADFALAEQVEDNVHNGHVNLEIPPDTPIDIDGKTGIVFPERSKEQFADHAIQEAPDQLPRLQSLSVLLRSHRDSLQKQLDQLEKILWNLAKGTSTARGQPSSTTPQDQLAKMENEAQGACDDIGCSANGKGHETNRDQHERHGNQNMPSWSHASHEVKKIYCLCGNKYAPDAIFCRKCGQKRDPNPDNGAAHCYCGNTYAADAIYCRKCGRKRNEAEEHSIAQETLAAQRNASYAYPRDTVVAWQTPPETALGKLSHTARWVVDHYWCETFFASLSIISAILIGIEVSWFAQNPQATRSPVIFLVLNHLLNYSFLAELLLRLCGYRLTFFTTHRFWHLMDVLIVGCGMSEVVVDIIVTGRNVSSSNVSDNMSTLRALRIMRALRLFRLAKLIHYFRELRILILSISNTLRSVVWAMVLLCIIIYTFAIVFQQTVNEELQLNTASPDMKAFFSDVPQTMITLLEAVSGGVSWIEIMKVLEDLGSVWQAAFLVYFSFVYFAVLNVVTGVFCNSAIESAQRDREAAAQDQLSRKHNYTVWLAKLFSNLDSDNSGCITVQELEQNLEAPEIQSYFHALEIDTDAAWKLFDLLDPDDNGSVEIHEFVEGCLRLRGPAKRIDSELALSVTRQNSAYLLHILTAIENLSSSLCLS
eukprot:TRINITY_DN23937_c0_g1_i1.p1 TRINITY_DN23937_c0_g1~~TRINITY_DN23937_c0_g1_i1.p1  ORF type:complete len:754 (-),score=80.73 TRINITY_DN23937_c0_g1_i1:44-2305(-)